MMLLEKNNDWQFLVLLFGCLFFTSSAWASVNAMSHQYQDWAYKCTPSQNSLALPACEVSQVVKIARHGQRITILELALSKKDQQHKVLSILAPLNLYLPSGFEFSWGKKHHTKAVPFLMCSRQGCLARMPVTAALLDGFRHQTRATALFRLANSKVVRLTFSLKGFSDAFAALQHNRSSIR